jgi:hypothetical protein
MNPLGICVKLLLRRLQDAMVEDKQNALVLKNCAFSRTNLSDSATKSGLKESIL